MYRVFIALRYLRTRTTAYLSVVAVLFGVATLLTVLSIMEGYILRLQEMIREQEADLVIRGPDPRSLCGFEEFERVLTTIPEVRGIAPFVRCFAMYRSGRFNPCFMRGVEPETELQVTRLGNFIFRPEELDEILAAAKGLKTADAFQRAIEDQARELLKKPERAPLTAEEVSRFFSLEWRKEVFDRENPAFRGEFLERGAPGGILVGVHFLTSRNLQLGEVVKVLTINPKTNEPIDGEFLVTGAFKTGDYEMDSRSFFVDFNRLTSFVEAFDPKRNEVCFDGIRIAIEDSESVERLESAREAIRQRLSGLPDWTGAHFARVQSWQDTKQIFIKAVELEKWIMGFVVSLLNVFTSCIILLMLVLIVIEKTRDAGILLAVGARPSGVFSIFLLTGVLITIFGIVLGVIVGTLFVNSINVVHDAIYQWTGHRLFDPEVYLMDHIPVHITVQDIFFSIVPAILFSLLASLIPALWASRKDPIQAIHYE